MTTATTPARTLTAVPDTPTGIDGVKRCSYSLTVHTRYRGKLRTDKVEFGALALLDGASMLNLGGRSEEQAQALKAMLYRVTVDDDGVGRDVETRLLREDQVSYAWLDDDETDEPEGDEPDDGPQTIPTDAVLAKAKKSALVDLAEQYDIDTDGTNADVAERLGARRDQLAAAEEPGAELAVPDADGVFTGEIEDEPARWRLVWPRDSDAAESDPWELAAEEEFATQRAAIQHAFTYGSSLRRLSVAMLDADTILEPASVNDAVGVVAEAASGRPTKRSGSSRRSSRTRGRQGRTSGAG